MNTPADLLWRINNEYHKRLKQVQTYLSLLEQLLSLQPESQPTLPIVRQLGDQIDTLLSEHRDWRYEYYYESLKTRRIVQEHGAINRALSQFTRMRASHVTTLAAIHTDLYNSPRPASTATQVPNGNLWDLTQTAVAELEQFDRYMHSLTQV